MTVTQQAPARVAAQDRRWLLPLLVGVLLLDLFAPNVVLLAVLAFATFISAASGSHRLTYFFVAASGVQAMDMGLGVPGVGWTGVALAGGVLMALLIQPGKNPLPFGLVVVAMLLVPLWFLSPPREPAATVAAIGLVALPLFYQLLRALPGEPEPITPVFVAAGLVASVAPGLVDALTTVLTDTAGYSETRVFQSAIGSSNYAAGLAAVAGVAAFSAGRAHSRLLTLVSLPFLAAPFVLASRGALLAEVTALGLLFFIERRGGVASALKPLFALIASTGLLMLAAERQWFWFERLTPGHATAGYTSGRIPLWDFALKQWATSPLVGRGPGGGTTEMLAWTGLAYPHNFIISWLVQVGIVGTLIMAIVLWPHPLLQWTVAAAPLVTLLVHSMVEPMIDTPIGAVFMAVLLAAYRIPRSSSEAET